MNKADIDKLYVTHQSNSLNQAHTRTLPFLGFAITLNMAFIGAVLLNEQTINYIKPLTIIMTLMNLALFLINYREQRINRILSDAFYKKFATLCSKNMLDIFKLHIEYNDRKLTGLTGTIFLVLYSWFLALPFYAYRVRTKPTLLSSEHGILIISIIVAIINGCVFHLKADLIEDRPRNALVQSKWKIPKWIYIIWELIFGVLMLVVLVLLLKY